MCITRVGKIIASSGNRATVRFLDDDVELDVDVSMLGHVEKNSYVEVFAESAISSLTRKEAMWRKKIWIELRRKTE